MTLRSNDSQNILDDLNDNFAEVSRSSTCFTKFDKLERTASETQALEKLMEAARK